MKTLATIRYYWGAFVISIIVGLIMIPAIFIFRKNKGAIIHYLNRLILLLIGGKLAQQGEMDKEADMYVLNHQGIIDIIGLEALQKNHLRWIAKQELFDTPWFGSLLRLGEMIAIDRRSKSGLRKLLKEVKISHEKYNRGVAVFPEGTRTNKQALLPFKEGTKMLAETLKLKIQPIVITGSKALLNEHDYTAHSSTIHYHFLDTIEVSSADENWYETLKITMQKVIDEQYATHHISR